MKIPIQNIYYLLCYAWNKLEEKDKVAVDVAGNTELVDLFAKILINASKLLLKRGLDKSYIERTDEINGIKGKIAIARTLQKNLLVKQRTICTYDEFSANILTNQILVSTLQKLLKVKQLDKGLKQEVRALLFMFPSVQTIVLRRAHFQQVRLHRNNRFYDFILKVCALIFENMLASEEVGTYRFSDFTRDERKMRTLFEKFIFNFYKIEQKIFRVKSERFDWQMDALDELSKDYLPTMNTDISLIGKEQKIIIDAKFSNSTLAEGRFGNKRIKTAHLYQIFSYLLNQENPDDGKTMMAKGILLYPMVGEKFDLNYRYGNHDIQIKTVNLNVEWREIRRQLLDLLNFEANIQED